MSTKKIFMKFLTPSCALVLCSFLLLPMSACSTNNPESQADDAGSKPSVHAIHTSMHSPTDETESRAPTPERNPASRPSSDTADLKVPKNFSAYASEPISSKELCVVGASTDDDGMNQKPIAYVSRMDKHPIWIARFDLPANTYQGRATHCSRSGDALLVLLQSDTQAAQTMSQTLLRVVKLDAMTGVIRESHDVNISGAYTA